MLCRHACSPLDLSNAAPDRRSNFHADTEPGNCFATDHQLPVFESRYGPSERIDLLAYQSRFRIPAHLGIACIRDQSINI
jgi:hypothetical protein